MLPAKAHCADGNLGMGTVTEVLVMPAIADGESQGDLNCPLLEFQPHSHPDDSLKSSSTRFPQLIQRRRDQTFSSRKTILRRGRNPHSLVSFELATAHKLLLVNAEPSDPERPALPRRLNSPEGRTRENLRKKFQSSPRSCSILDLVVMPSTCLVKAHDGISRH